jgi:hypothetical protein
MCTLFIVSGWIKLRTNWMLAGAKRFCKPSWMCAAIDRGR